MTKEDISGLRSWHTVFGDTFEPVLMFAYWLVGTPTRIPSLDIHAYRNEHYAFIPVSAIDYEEHARLRSPKWNTISVSTRTLQSLAQKMEHEHVA